MYKTAKQLNYIANKLDACGEYKLATRITKVLVRLSQIDPNNTALMTKQYSNPQVLSNPTAFGAAPPATQQTSQYSSEAMKQPVPGGPDISEYENLKGTKFYQNLPYMLSQQYQYDLRNPKITPEQQKEMAEQFELERTGIDPLNLYGNFMNSQSEQPTQTKVPPAVANAGMMPMGPYAPVAPTPQNPYGKSNNPLANLWGL